MFFTFQGDILWLHQTVRQWLYTASRSSQYHRRKWTSCVSHSELSWVALKSIVISEVWILICTVSVLTHLCVLIIQLIIQLLDSIQMLSCRCSFLLCWVRHSLQYWIIQLGVITFGSPFLGFYLFNRWVIYTLTHIYL